MKNFKSHFKFNKQERSGIFFLLFLIVSIQLGYFFFRSFPSHEKNALNLASKSQERVDSLKQLVLRKDTITLYPFNPNFITDYKGYTLGMSVEEIDRLHAFRTTGKFVNSIEEFQVVTQISDSLLNTFARFFKFPEWTKTNLKNQKELNYSVEKIEIFDLNKATVKDLQVINGIGKKLSTRIVKFRDRLGGFLVQEQLFDVYGLEVDVADRLLKRFKVLSTPVVKKININTASVSQLVKLIYIRYDVAQEIVAYREKNGKFNSFNELTAVDGFPTEKIDRIVLYLSLKD